MRGLRILWIWAQVGGAVLATLAIMWLSAQWLFHLKILSVQTGSMRPSFSPGDALLLQRIQPSQLQHGTIVSYRSSRSPNELVTHRLVRVGQGSFQTKGDALTIPDPVVRDSLLVGRVTAVLPGMGRLLNWLRSWPGLIAFVYVPVGMVVAGELYRLERYYRSRHIYQLVTDRA